MYEFKTILAGPTKKEEIVDKNFVLTSAWLDAELVDDNPSSVLIEYENSSFILCTLIPNSVESFNFHLEFYSGEIFNVSVIGNNKIHLNGSIIGEDTNDVTELKNISSSIFSKKINPKEVVEIDNDEEIEFCVATLDPEFKAVGRTSLIAEINGLDVTLCTVIPQKIPNAFFSFRWKSKDFYKFKVVGENSLYLIGNYIYEEEENECYDEHENDSDYSIGEQLIAEQFIEDSFSDEEVSEEEEPMPEPSKKKIKGLKVTTLKQGKGTFAKRGDKLEVFYTGKLENGKVFDKTKKKPFEFTLGAGEVIQGWDKGIEGMKIGEKRRLVISPSLGYGNKKIGKIPANSTLVFDIFLKSINKP
ncbi:FK506-binding protein 4 [Astathelohania contejeani]|uniref:peptidylprolyl isomerase n=1 Tax=Astathelohania contejeani TaxID=164912 RepID=A0ABQ7HXR5_9MICR|nr:FK506-binding protein 4 [Thelohania contejeani]